MCDTNFERKCQNEKVCVKMEPKNIFSEEQKSTDALNQIESDANFKKKKK